MNRSLPSLLSLAVLFSLLLSTGCATKRPFRQISYQEWSEKRSRSALTGDHASTFSQRYLRRADLSERFAADPLGVLVELDKQLCPEPTREELFVLAELSYLEARKAAPGTAEARTLYLSAARYSYAYLFDDSAGPPVNEFDPQIRLAIDLYNHALAGAFESRQTDWTTFVATGRRVPLVRGHATITVSENSYVKLEDIDRGTAAHRLEVTSLQNHFHRSGIGLPVMAKRDVDIIWEAPEDEEPPVRLAKAFSATGLLRFPDPICDAKIETEGTRAILDSYDPIQTPTVKIGSKEVPLEADLTVPLAFMFEEGSRNLGGSGLRGMYQKLQGEFIAEKRGMILLQPYQEGKIPVLFVHGLLSSPLTWVQMINDLMADPDLTPHYQFAFYFYPTGNPILFSASEMRTVLKAYRQEVDPDRGDAALDQSVLVGHSMGGLLSRLMISTSDGDFLKGFSGLTFDDLDLPEEHKESLRKVDTFQPIPSIRRVIFMATPHRGANMASGLIGRIGDSLTVFPRYLVDEIGISLAEAGIKKKNLDSGIDNLRYRSNFMTTLEKLPLAPDVPYHLIIGNDKEAGVAGGTDGVVKYDSSHIEGAVSERIVKSGHNVQTQAPTILEVRRILLQHLEELDW